MVPPYIKAQMVNGPASERISLEPGVLILKSIAATITQIRGA